MWAFWTQRAAWTWSLSTTRHPRPRAHGLVATLDRGENIRGAVRTSHRRVAHRARHYHRRIRGQHQVEDVSDFLDRVRSLGHHRADAAILQRLVDGSRQFVQVGEVERGSRLVAEVLDAEFGLRVTETGNRGKQVRCRQGW